MSRAPVLFVSHGAPTVALEVDGAYARALRAFAAATPGPRAIAIVSAHWEADREIGVTSAPRNRLVYDFSGFPEELYRIRWPAPGAPDVAARAAELLREAGFPSRLDPQRGLDHGAWAPLRLGWPDARVPVVQIALPDAPPATLLALGAALAPLRDEGVLLVGSGGLVHNLFRVRFGDEGEPDAWAAGFDAWAAARIEAQDAEGLARFEEAPGAALSVPTPEHFAPVLVALGARLPGDEVETLHASFQHGNIGMRSFALRPAAEPPPLPSAA
jgi:4,5-DOPA dioxygenase extradiol